MLLGPGGRSRRILRTVLATLIGEEVACGEPSAGAPPREAVTPDTLDPLDERLVDFVREIGPLATLGLALSLWMIEWGTPIWLGTLRPFTRLPGAERERYLRGFEQSRLYLRQRLLFPMRFLGTVLHYSGEETARATGYEPPRIDRSGAGED